MNKFCLMRPLLMGLGWLLLSCACLSQPTVLWQRSVDWGEVRVVQDGALRRLLFLSAAGETVESELSLQRPDELSLPYTRQMMAVVALWESRRPETAKAPSFLLVGLGGGSLSKAVARQFPGGEVTTVEIEPAVVEAARRFFDYQESSRVTTVVDDARHFLETTDGHYDVVLVDAFDEGGAPTALRSVEFFALLRDHLRPYGVVISNVHYDPWTPARRYMASALEVFPHLYGVGSPWNGAVAFSSEPLTGLTLWERSEEFSQRYGLPVMDLLRPRLSLPEADPVEPYRD